MSPLYKAERLLNEKNQDNLEGVLFLQAQRAKYLLDRICVISAQYESLSALREIISDIFAIQCSLIQVNKFISVYQSILIDYEELGRDDILVREQIANCFSTLMTGATFSGTEEFKQIVRSQYAIIFGDS